MHPFIAREEFNFTPAALTGLEECSEESVYAPGYIQPQGVLLTLQKETLKILQVSENVEQFFEFSAASVLGQPLERLFSHDQVKQVAEVLRQDNPEQGTPFDLTAQSQTFRGTLHQTVDTLILELEPQRLNENPHFIQFYNHLQTAALSLRKTTSLVDLAQTLAQQVRAITKFDRVMIYRFEADDHGVVIAEEKEPHLQSYLGLHFPAIDIPVPARKLFLHKWVRQIPDVNYTPVRIISADDCSNGPSVDLRDCLLRGVSPYHVEYLQHMGVAASLTISLMDDQRLWGLIACHHHSPKQISYETRKTCEYLGQLSSIELVHHQDQELEHYRTHIQAIQNKLQQAFVADPTFIQQVLTDHSAELLTLVHAEGLAIALDQHISLVGQTPSLENVRALLTWLPQQETETSRPYLTHCLVRLYPPARAFTKVASGLLAISIVLHQKAYHLIWFRPEQIQTVNWAGNPQDAITVDELGKLQLCPRKSFELWKETVRQTSLPWQSTEIEAAKMMRTTLMLAVLEFSQAALEQAASRAAIANRAKSQFLAKMSHELRTPLNAILGFAQVMNHSPSIPSEFQDYLNIISRSGEHLLTLINDVLEMSRIEAGQLVLTERHFNLHNLLRSLQDMFALKTTQKGVKLLFEQAPNIPLYICGDEAKLRQILINLISNAIKFTTQGSVTVQTWVTKLPTTDLRCTCYPSDPSSCQALKLTIMVKDTGCGIDPRDWDSVFEAFMQTEQGRNADGTGLGLCISRQFARLMGGDITLESTPSQGSVFTCHVILHQHKMMDVLESETSPFVIGLEPGQPTYRILVVEDLPENQQLMVALLEPIGFEVRTVKNGVDAIELWNDWHPHLILMDIQMPGMTGYEVTQQIRLQETATQSSPTPIIALTAYAFETDRIASLQAGFNKHIAKPFIKKTLFEAIAQYLGVRYRYGQPMFQEPAPALPKTLTLKDLSTMPTQWLEQMHDAALDLNDKKLHQLIAQIPIEEQWLIESLTALVNDFQLEAIAALTYP